MGERTEVAGPPAVDMAMVYRLWCRLGLALLCAGMAYDGRAEAICEEEPGRPRLTAAARALGVRPGEARVAVLWLLGEGESQGQGELARLVGLLAALLTGLPSLFRQGLCLPLARRATRLLPDNDGGGRSRGMTGRRWRSPGS